MNRQIPISQQFDAFELESRGLREFFKVELLTDAPTTLYLTPHVKTQWLDQVWEEVPCKMTDTAQNSNGEMNRPKFAVVNPQGLFSLWIEAGLTEGALLTRYRILLSDLEAGVAAYTKSVWIISKVLSLNKDMVTFECRSTLDGAGYELPARTFYPPDFPHVSLR